MLYILIVKMYISLLSNFIYINCKNVYLFSGNVMYVKCKNVYISFE